MKEENILITGSDGMVGSELKKLWPNAIHISRRDYDLTSENEIMSMFHDHKPDCIIHLAAKVGGILDNIENPASYFDENVLMNTLLVKHAHLNKVDRFVAILSSCIYPDKVDVYPMKENMLHQGPPTKTNFSYGYAKRSMAVQIDAYNEQHDTKYNYIIPCNLYSNNDKLDKIKSHFIAALVVKINEAVINGDDHILLFGDGTPLRQFIHAEDLANIIKITIDREIYTNFNIASYENLTIDEMARVALKETGNDHLEIRYDTNVTNGQHRKDINVDILHDLIPDYKFITLADGIRAFYNHISNTQIHD